jgi:dipeptidyl-peptidase-4
MDLFAAVNRHGDTLNVKTYYPANYVNNGSVKYPAIVYWYGGPHAQMVTNSWNAGSGDYWFKYMAQQGFMIIVPDVRGSDNRGKEFEQSMFRELGKVQMEDLEDVLKYYDNAGIDKKRMGLFGWSFGGFMTTDFVLNHPGTFKAAVAGGPVMDWHLYEIMYTERYMDTPAENPDGYKSTNLIDQAGKLKDRLLLIHGLQDPVVVQQHSVNFVKAAVDKGVLIDYMIYPGHEHNVTGKDRLHLYRKITDYFMLHLK